MSYNQVFLSTIVSLYTTRGEVATKTQYFTQVFNMMLYNSKPARQHTRPQHIVYV